MKSIEEQFKMKKEVLDNLDVPEELEDRLNTALKSQHKSNIIMRHKIAASLLIILLLLGIYNFDVLAYYGRKISGYDKVIYGSLKNLNELGEGQGIGKSYTFKDGTTVVLDKIFLDTNKLSVMYRVNAENQDKALEFSGPRIRGSITEFMPNSGMGTYDSEKKEAAFISDFDVPKIIINKNLTFSISPGDNSETGSIEFNLDMSRAIKGAVKQKINKTIESEGVKYSFAALSATPLSTIIEGTIDSGLNGDLFSFEKNGVRRNLVLEVNETYEKDGKIAAETLQPVGSSVSSGIRTKFRYEFDGLKKDIKELSLNIVKTEDVKIIDKEIKVDYNTANINVNEILISDVKLENGNTVISYITDKNISYGEALMINGKQRNAINESEKLIDGGNKVLKTVTYEGNGVGMSLLFKTISFDKPINKEFIIYKAAD